MFANLLAVSDACEEHSQRVFYLSVLLWQDRGCVQRSPATIRRRKNCHHLSAGRITQNVPQLRLVTRGGVLAVMRISPCVSSARIPANAAQKTFPQHALNIVVFALNLQLETAKQKRNVKLILMYANKPTGVNQFS